MTNKKIFWPNLKGKRVRVVQGSKERIVDITLIVNEVVVLQAESFCPYSPVCIVKDAWGTELICQENAEVFLLK